MSYTNLQSFAWQPGFSPVKYLPGFVICLFWLSQGYRSNPETILRTHHLKWSEHSINHSTENKMIQMRQIFVFFFRRTHRNRWPSEHCPGASLRTRVQRNQICGLQKSVENNKNAFDVNYLLRYFWTEKLCGESNIILNFVFFFCRCEWMQSEVWYLRVRCRNLHQPQKLRLRLFLLPWIWPSRGQKVANDSLHGYRRMSGRIGYTFSRATKAKCSQFRGRKCQIAFHENLLGAEFYTEIDFS